jgi:hypothetical protein
VAGDPDGNAAVAGFTPSADYPTTAGAFSRTRSGSGASAIDAFIAKLDADGSDLLFSTYLGGTNVEQDPDDAVDHKMGIAIGPGGEVWAGGLTHSNDFPATAGAFQEDTAGDVDACVARLSTSGGLVWASYLGGAQRDRIFCLDVDASGSVYVGGHTTSGNTFPQTPGAFLSGGSAFLAKLAADGSSLTWATTLDTSGARVLGCAVDAAGSVFATGKAGAAGLTASAGAFQETYGGGFSDAFVAKVNPDGGSVAYLSFLGGNAEDEGWDIDIDGSEQAAVAGTTFSPDFPVTQGAYDPNFGGGSFSDVFAARISANGTASSSRPSSAARRAIRARRRIRRPGPIWVAGNTVSPNFPTTPTQSSRRSH